MMYNSTRLGRRAAGAGGGPAHRSAGGPGTRSQRRPRRGRTPSAIAYACHPRESPEGRSLPWRPAPAQGSTVPTRLSARCIPVGWRARRWSPRHRRPSAQARRPQELSVPTAGRVSKVVDHGEFDEDWNGRPQGLTHFLTDASEEGSTAEGIAAPLIGPPVCRW